jgi:prophage regulatory protein
MSAAPKLKPIANQDIVETECRDPDESPRARVMLNEKQVLAIVPVSTVTLWRMEKEGRFPKSSYISPNRRIWFEDEIIAWQTAINGQGRGWRKHKS